MLTHKHHIIPKHAGGTDDKSNLIDLSVAEHAEAHRLLFEKYGRWQDRVAWKALSGQITSDEARRQSTRETWLGRKHTEIAIQNIKDGIRKSKYVRPPCKEETKRKISNTLMGHEVSEETRHRLSESNSGRVVSEETKLKLSVANKGKTLSKEHIEKLREPKTAEHKQKISKGNTGKVRSDETKEKIRTIRTGTKASQETKDKMSIAHKGKKITWELNNITPESNKKEVIV